MTSQGGPIEGAKVALHTAVTRANRASVEERSTDGRGDFDLGIRAPGFYDVVASAPGKTAAILRIDLSDPLLKPPSDHLELRLQDCAASVSGTVVDASGNALSHVFVRWNGIVGTQSDANGAYKLCIPIGDSELEFSADGYGATTLTVTAVGNVERDVVLVPAAAVVVQVVRSDDGSVIADAHVSAFSQDWGADRPAIATGMTGDTGIVRLQGLIPGRYKIGGFADGFESEVSVDALAAVGVEANVVLRLTPRARVVGRVIDGTSPVIGARVVAVRRSPMARSGSGVSQADGSFVLERVPLGEVTFLAAPYEVEDGTLLQVSEAKNYEGVVLNVRRLGAIRGIVTRHGQPVDGAVVCCVPTASDAKGRTVSDQNGRYEFLGVKPGNYDLFAQSDGAGAFNKATSVTLVAGEELVVNHDLNLAATIAGKVVDVKGQPVKGALVQWRNELSGDLGRCVSDIDGSYRCTAMSGAGTYRAAVFRGSGTQAPFPTADGSPYPARELEDGATMIEGVTLAIDRTQLRISGHVIDQVGRAVPDTIVRAETVTPGTSAVFRPWERLPITSTDESGEFVLRDLLSGNYALQARSPDGGEGVVPLVPAGSDAVTMRIERSSVIEGKLIGFRDTPSVIAQLAGASSFTGGVVDGTSFRISGLRPGRYYVNAQTTFEGSAQSVMAHAGETVQLLLTSQGRGTVVGRVLNFKTRTPVAGISCHVVMAVDGHMLVTNWDLATAARSDGSGLLTIDPAPAGEIAVECVAASYRWSAPSAEAKLEIGDSTTLNLLTVELTSDSPGSVGIEFDYATPAPRIFAVRPNSTASAAGLLTGDLVVEAGSTPVAGLNGAGVSNLIANVAIGDDITIGVIRDGVKKEFTLKVTPRPL